jgi:hypothetical protein
MSRTGAIHEVRRTRAGRRTGDGGRGREPFQVYARLTAVSGILFAGLFIAALVLVRQAPGLAAPDRVYTAFYTVGRGNVLVTVGLYIVPFAGIAYLWHMSATRMLIESLPGSTSELPGWLQLTAGVLFVCMLFAGTAAVGAVALLTVFSTTPLPSPEVARTLTAAGYGMVFVFGVRAAGMYMITTTTLIRRRALLPRPLAVVSHLGAAFLLLSTTFHPATLLVFPGWVLLLSVVLLVHAARPPRPSAAPSPLPDQRTSHEHDDRP